MTDKKTYTLPGGERTPSVPAFVKAWTEFSEQFVAAFGGKVLSATHHFGVCWEYTPGMTVQLPIDPARLMLAKVRDMYRWINDLHSGMYVNCVYCGHRYGPMESTPTSRSDLLTAHISVCEKHPMRALADENARLKKEIREAYAETPEVHDCSAEVGPDLDTYCDGHSTPLSEIVRRLREDLATERRKNR